MKRLPKPNDIRSKLLRIIDKEVHSPASSIKLHLFNIDIEENGHEIRFFENYSYKYSEEVILSTISSCQSETTLQSTSTIETQNSTPLSNGIRFLKYLKGNENNNLNIIRHLKYLKVYSKNLRKKPKPSGNYTRFEKSKNRTFQGRSVHHCTDKRKSCVIIL